jgi:hypothetical protein
MANLAKENKISIIDLSQKREQSEWSNTGFFSGCDQYFTMYGQEMYPVYQPGQVMMCKEYKHLDFIPYGNAFLIVTDCLRLVRYVKKSSSPNHLYLVSENPHFDTIEVPKAAIISLFLIVGTIKTCGL